MIQNRQQLDEILERIELGENIHEDIAILREALTFDSGGLACIQIGRDNINIGSANDITIQRIYNGSRPEFMRQTFQDLLYELLPVRNRRIQRLRRFEQTNRCHTLLENPNNIGYISTKQLLIINVLMLIVFTFMFFVLFANWIDSNIDFLVKVALVSLTIHIGFVVYVISRIVKFARKLSQGERLIATKPVHAAALVVIRLSRDQMDRLTTVALIDSNNRNYYAAPHSIFKGTTLCEGDVGVAYLQEGQNEREYETDYLLLGFESQLP